MGGFSRHCWKASPSGIKERLYLLAFCDLLLLACFDKILS